MRSRISTDDAHTHAQVHSNHYCIESIFIIVILIIIIITELVF